MHPGGMYAGQPLGFRTSNPASSARGEVEVTVQLEDELRETLTRRRGRRLRDLQTDHQVSLVVDRINGVLRITGSLENVTAAKRTISHLGGVSKSVTEAVWSELMRTRLMTDAYEEAALARLQHTSGTRIHIERGRAAVRIFGAKECISIASAMLDELADDCVALTVNGVEHSSDTLSVVGETCQVAFRKEEASTVILGRTRCVEKAKAHLDRLAATGADVHHKFPYTAPAFIDERSTALSSRQVTLDRDDEDTHDWFWRRVFSPEQADSASEPPAPTPPAAETHGCCQPSLAAPGLGPVGERMDLCSMSSDTASLWQGATARCSSCGALRSCGTCGARAWWRDDLDCSQARATASSGVSQLHTITVSTEERLWLEQRRREKQQQHVSSLVKAYAPPHDSADVHFPEPHGARMPEHEASPSVAPSGQVHGWDWGAQGHGRPRSQ